jgi:hypothetical protein
MQLAIREVGGFAGGGTGAEDTLYKSEIWGIAATKVFVHS